MGYLESRKKAECFGCGACAQACKREALHMAEDEEGFAYPAIDISHCVQCGVCGKVCPQEHMPSKYHEEKYVFGGYHSIPDIRFESTSGGAFTAIVDAWCDENYVIFGAMAKGLEVMHSYVTDKKEIAGFRKSKYSQSAVGKSYQQAKQFLLEGKKVLFSGTPCQIAGLRAYLGDMDLELFLTVEVVCEGVPSPLYIKKYEKYLEKKYGQGGIKELDYRYTGKSIFNNGKWDFQQHRVSFWGKKCGGEMGFRDDESEIDE